MKFSEIQSLKGAFSDECAFTFYNEQPNDVLCIGLLCKYDKAFNLKTIELAHKNKYERYEIKKDTGIAPITVSELDNYIKDFTSKHKIPKSNKVVLFAYLNEQTQADLLFIRNFDVYKDNSGNINFYTDKKSPDIAIFDLFKWVDDSLTDKKSSAKLNYEIGTQIKNHVQNEYDIDILNNPTPAKTGINIFRKNYINPNKPILPPNHLVRTQALLSNWGGVSIAFKRGIFKGNFNYYDARSMFPSCAIAIGALPLKENWERVYDIEDLIKLKGGVATVKFKFPDTERYPCLPISLNDFGHKNWKRTVDIKKIFYPLEGMSYCTSYEIALALDKGANLELVTDNEGLPFAYGYEYGDSQFVKFLRDLRFKKEIYSNEKENWSKAKAYSKLYKNIANFSIGKLLSKYSIHTGCFYPEWNTLIIGKSRAINFKAFELTNAYIGTTDSTITDMNLGNGFVIDGIQYELKKIGTELGILRSKVYYLKDNNKIVHSAHSGLSLLPDDEHLIEQFIKEGLNYPYINHSLPEILNTEQMKRAKINNLKFNQQLKTYWDNQRVLLSDGSTKPLKDESELKKQIWDKMGYYKRFDRISEREINGMKLTVSQKEFKKELWERMKDVSLAQRNLYSIFTNLQ